MKKLLIIEDNSALMDAYEKHVHSFMRDYTLLKAYTGAAGISLASSEKPEVIVLETDLQDMDGLEVLKSIRTHLPHSTIIMYSASTNIRTQRKAREFGADAFEGKLDNKKSFDQMIIQAVKKRAQPKKT